MDAPMLTFPVVNYASLEVLISFLIAQIVLYVIVQLFQWIQIRYYYNQIVLLNNKEDSKVIQDPHQHHLWLRYYIYVS